MSAMSTTGVTLLRKRIALLELQLESSDNTIQSLQSHLTSAEEKLAEALGKINSSFMNAGSKQFSRRRLEIAELLNTSVHHLYLLMESEERVGDEHAHWLGKAMMHFINLIFHRRRATTKCSLLLDVVFNGLVYEKALYKDELLNHSRTLIRNTIYKPYLLQKTIDSATVGGLNYGAIEELRKLEKRKNQKCCMPGTMKVGQTARDLEEYAKTIIPWSDENTEYGPTYQFQFEPILRFLMESYGLTEYCLETCTGPSVLLSFTLDGAALTKYLSHLLAGVKIVDTRAKDPFSNEPLFLNTKFQSREVCFPMKILFATDSKSAYRVVMKDWFDFIDQVSEFGLPYSSEFGPAMRPFKVMAPANMAATWKMCAAGGGSYTMIDFCPQCRCKNHDRGTPARDVDRCERCVLRDIECCYDEPVVDSEELAKYKAELLATVTTNLPTHYAKFDLIREKSLIRPLTVTIDQVGASNDKFSIKFTTDGRDDEVVAEYNQLLMAELLIRYPQPRFSIWNFGYRGEKRVPASGTPY